MAHHTIINTDPASFYVLETAPHQDRSRNRLANLTLSNALHPLTAFNSGKLAVCPPTFTVPTNVTNPVWSIGIVAKAVTATTAKILEFTSSGGTGLWYSGGRLYFGLKHADASTTITSCPIELNRVYDIYCVKDEQAILLYAEGLLVASAEIESASPVVISPTLTVGDTVQRVFAANPVTWNKAVRANDILSISIDYRNYPARKSLTDSTVSGFYTPELLSVNNHDASIDVALSNGVVESSSGTYLSGIDEGGVSVDSSITFKHLVQDISHGLRFSWSSSFGATVEFSLNGGVSWSPVLNGRIVTGTGQPAQNVLALVRVSFLAGSAERPFISGVKLLDYTTSILNPLTASLRTAVLSGDVYIPHTAHHPQLHGDGMRFYGNGIMEILPQTGDVISNTAALEIVFSPEATDLTGTKYVVNSAPEHSSNIAVTAGKLTFSGFSTVYVNGSATATNSLTLIAGVNYHIAANYTSPNNAKVTFGSEGASVTGPISTFSLRNTAFTAPTASSAFQRFLSYPLYRPTADTGVAISDDVVSIYSKEWTIRGT